MCLWKKRVFLGRWFCEGPPNLSYGESLMGKEFLWGKSWNNASAGKSTHLAQVQEH